MCRTAHIYINGFCFHDGLEDAKAGIGVWWGKNNSNNVSEPLYGRQNHNRAIINAAIYGIKQVLSSNYCCATVHTNSQYLIDCVTKNIRKWQTNGWITSKRLPVANKFDFLELLDLLKKIPVHLEKVECSIGYHGIFEAEKLARIGSKKFNQLHYDEYDDEFFAVVDDNSNDDSTNYEANENDDTIDIINTSSIFGSSNEETDSLDSLALNEDNFSWEESTISTLSNDSFSSNENSLSGESISSSYSFFCSLYYIEYFYIN